MLVPQEICSFIRRTGCNTGNSIPKKKLSFTDSLTINLPRPALYGQEHLEKRVPALLVCLCPAPTYAPDA